MKRGTNTNWLTQKNGRFVREKKIKIYIFLNKSYFLLFYVASMCAKYKMLPGYCNGGMYGEFMTLFYCYLLLFLSTRKLPSFYRLVQVPVNYLLLVVVAVLSFN